MADFGLEYPAVDDCHNLSLTFSNMVGLYVNVMDLLTTVDESPTGHLAPICDN